MDPRLKHAEKFKKSTYSEYELRDMGVVDKKFIIW